MRVAEDLLPQKNRFVVGFGHVLRRQIRQANEVLVQPLAVGLLCRHPGLQFGVINDAAFPRIHEEHLAGLKTPLQKDVVGRDVQHSDFGSHDDQSILGDTVT